MVYVINVARVLLTAGVLFGFPALALHAWRKHGPRRLTIVTLGTAFLVVAFSLAAASPQFGNRLEESVGFGVVARGSLFLFGFTFGMPIFTTILAVLLLRRDLLPFWAVYAASVGAAAFGWMLGVIGAVWFQSFF